MREEYQRTADAQRAREEDMDEWRVIVVPSRTLTVAEGLPCDVTVCIARSGPAARHDRIAAQFSAGFRIKGWKIETMYNTDTSILKT